MLRKHPPGGGLWRSLSRFKSPYGDARRNLGLMNGEKRLPPLCELKKKGHRGRLKVFVGRLMIVALLWTMIR